MIYNESIELMEAVAALDVSVSTERLLEYTEVGFIDRVFNTGDDQYHKWIKSCTSKSELKEFIHNMEGVIGERAKITKVSFLIGLGKFVLRFIAVGATSQVIDKAIPRYNQGAKIAGVIGLAHVNQKIEDRLDESNVRRFKPMIEAAKKRIKEIEEKKL